MTIIKTKEVNKVTLDPKTIEFISKFTTVAINLGLDVAIYHPI